MTGPYKPATKIWKRHKQPVEVDEKKRFHDIAGKNDSHAYMPEKKPRITLDNRLTWKAHVTEAKVAKRMHVLRSLAGTNWGTDQHWSAAA
jgi:hypothetical protein